MRKFLLKWPLMVLILLLSTGMAWAQGVTGKVMDENGEALAGVSVVIKGSAQGVMTDINGSFTLSPVSESSILVFSFVGMISQEVRVGNRSKIEVTLKSSDRSLEEVVVVGYGTARRSDITSSITSLKAQELKDMPAAGIDQLLQGKAAGVTVTSNGGQPGGGVSVKVRGVTSINSNDPLFVIDGVPFINGNTSNSTGYDGLGGSNGQTGNSVMAMLNPNDIESIDVLKDASAQAIYGSQAANGVIMITTKKGKAGTGKITYETYFGVSEVARKLDLMNLQEFARYQNEILPIIGITPSEEFADPSLLGKGTDWQEAMFQKGAIQNHQLSFSGGQNKTNYYVSLNYFNNKGILIGSDFERYATRLSFDTQLKSWAQVGMSLNASRSIQNVTLADAAESTIWWGAVTSPLVPLKNPDGSWGGGNTVGGIRYSNANLVGNSQYRGNTKTSTTAFGSVFAELTLLKGLSLRNELSFSLGLDNNIAFQKAGNVGGETFRSKLIDNRSDNYYYSLTNYFNYVKWINGHSFHATLGHQAQMSYWQAIGGTKVDLQANIMDLNTGLADQTTWGLNGGKGHWAMESWFARANYTYKDRYSVSASFRADGSSNFGPNNRWGYFPGVSVGWTASNESFMKEALPNTHLKIRAGYGLVGNQNFPGGAPNPAYVGAVQFFTGPVGFGTSNMIQGIPNPDLKWETVKTSNIGVDLGILKGRLDLTVDAYKKVTSDMIIFLTGPTLIGVGDAWDDLKAPLGNAGKMTNTGVDLGISSVNVSKENFTWRSNLVFTHFKNNYDQAASAASALDGRVYYNNYLITHTTPGRPVGSFWGLKTDGIFRTQADLDNSLPQFGYIIDPAQTWLGDIRFKDINNDKKIDAEDMTYIGSPLPKFTWGFTNSGNYKSFDFSVFLQGSYGAKAYNFLRWQIEGLNSAWSNQLKTVLDRYTESNPNGSLPRFTNTNANNTAMSDRYVEDASFWRIQNVTVGYRVPAHLLKKVNVRVYGSVQNIHTFTKYSGYDPEIGAFNNNIRLMNVDMGHYPNPRTFTIGANVEF
ncbi:TonB-dependent receptor [Leadbetterella byssophila DSM 17132]|uniref:TonB-dependent receptor n=1 Tax=Leadbetterella byssophila (strain DSM 17132 / JCM 16389 / KACC 11308 / NBRC 106382 / 4M15) TaxID=649349 RepID=E4RXX6_LEAB4|nr:TonB-dependent receptor [Leadbetterella byssophila]ADQ19073.1 TonB-dependent receptor [Leadbetterella byssophila DSM 17132]